MLFDDNIVIKSVKSKRDDNVFLINPVSVFSSNNLKFESESFMKSAEYHVPFILVFPIVIICYCI